MDDDRGRVALSTLVGAILGGLAGYFLFTAAGRRLRADLLARAERAVDDASRWQDMVVRLRDSVASGWAMLGSLLEATGEAGEEHGEPGIGEENVH